MKRIFPILIFLFAANLTFSQPCIPGCTPTSLDSIGILNVSLYTLNNSSPSVQCYVDYTAIPAPQLIAGESYFMSVTIGLIANPSVVPSQDLWVLVDWDGNGDFMGLNENIRTSNILPAETDNFTLTVPGGTGVGTYRLRVMSTITGFITGGWIFFLKNFWFDHACPGSITRASFSITR